MVTGNLNADAGHELPISLDAPGLVRKVADDRPWFWLQKGWQDLMRASTVSLAYGAALVLFSYVLVLGLYRAELGCSCANSLAPLHDMLPCSCVFDLRLSQYNSCLPRLDGPFLSLGDAPPEVSRGLDPPPTPPKASSCSFLIFSIFIAKPSAFF